MWTNLYNMYLGKRPFWGFGFNAFWYLDSQRVAMQVATGYPSPIGISDNGFIDILVNTGFIGLFLFLVFYFGTWWYALNFTARANNIIEMFPVILMSYTLLANISWSLIFENESFFMLLMVSILFYVSGKTSRTRLNQGIK